MQHTIRVAVDYRQFYLWDPTVTNRAPEDYSALDVQRRVKLDPSVVVVQPERDGVVDVVVDLAAADPGFTADACDHVVECSIDVPGGRLQVHECLGSAVLDVRLDPGVYAVRVLFTGLGSIDEDGLGGEDRYVVQLWPARQRSLVVIKQWLDAG